ncbi:Smr/MutS family protein [Mangrovimonas xylaniphaga]|uniref:Smr/MutS family protein n=1 Tax=Mangrovimonas xylaniphaga TaxID=1645915 RepID=UPI0006B5014A|nr:Smr/MutS family protein [Mangrovimonas xylaniphaga]
MSLQIGDKVSVLDEDITGIITTKKGDLFGIETTDGFVLEFYAHELIVIEASLKSEVFSEQSAFEVIQEKEIPQKRKSQRTKPKERNLPAMEVDLHIHQLTPKPNRLSNHEMLTLQLDTAERQLKFAISKRIQKVVFIHGVGEGVLKTELEYLFGRYNNVTFYAADYQKYGMGATEVYIYQNLEP